MKSLCVQILKGFLTCEITTTFVDDGAVNNFHGQITLIIATTLTTNFRIIVSTPIIIVITIIIANKIYPTKIKVLEAILEATVLVVSIEIKQISIATDTTVSNRQRTYVAENEKQQASPEIS